MNNKRLIGALLTLAGAGLITFAERASHKVGEAKTWVQSFTHFFQDTVWGNVVGKTAEGEVSKHDSTIQVCFIAGILLVSLGVFLMIRYRKKRWF